MSFKLRAETFDVNVVTWIQPLTILFKLYFE